jgi:transcriptional regulator with XRE-family HTH domain
VDVGALINEARQLAGITQTELASRMGTHQSVVARWETGKTQPTLETVIRAVEAAGLELTLNISGSNSNSPELSISGRENETTRMMQELRQMNADQARMAWIKGR